MGNYKSRLRVKKGGTSLLEAIASSNSPSAKKLSRFLLGSKIIPKGLIERVKVELSKVTDLPLYSLDIFTEVVEAGLHSLVGKSAVHPSAGPEHVDNILEDINNISKNQFFEPYVKRVIRDLMGLRGVPVGAPIAKYMESRRHDKRQVFQSRVATKNIEIMDVTKEGQPKKLVLVFDGKTSIKLRGPLKHRTTLNMSAKSAKQLRMFALNIIKSDVAKGKTRPGYIEFVTVPKSKEDSRKILMKELKDGGLLLMGRLKQGEVLTMDKVNARRLVKYLTSIVRPRAKSKKSDS